MLSIKAKTKYSEFKGMSGYIKVTIAIIIGSGLSLLSYFSFENLFALFTLLFSSILVLLIIITPPQEVQITLTEKGIFFDRKFLAWQSCHSWVMVDLDDAVEFIIQTSDFEASYYYFYVNDHQENIKDFILFTAQNIPYNEEIENKNYLHQLIRLLGLG